MRKSRDGVAVFIICPGSCPELGFLPWDLYACVFPPQPYQACCQLQMDFLVGSANGQTHTEGRPGHRCWNEGRQWNLEKNWAKWTLKTTAQTISNDPRSSKDGIILLNVEGHGKTYQTIHWQAGRPLPDAWAFLWYWRHQTDDHASCSTPDRFHPVQFQDTGKQDSFVRQHQGINQVGEDVWTELVHWAVTPTAFQFKQVTPEILNQLEDTQHTILMWLTWISTR